MLVMGYLTAIQQYDLDRRFMDLVAMHVGDGGTASNDDVFTVVF